jgi:hypothetical protein
VVLEHFIRFAHECSSASNSLRSLLANLSQQFWLGFNLESRIGTY